jgi:transposase
LYLAGGIELLCSHKKTGFRPSVISKEMHVVISSLLNDPQNGLRGYNELMIYLEKEFNKKIKYNTLLKYCIKNFKSSIKVARKSHIKKDIDAVNTFKKTSL